MSEPSSQPSPTKVTEQEEGKASQSEEKIKVEGTLAEKKHDDDDNINIRMVSATKPKSETTSEKDRKTKTVKVALIDPKDYAASDQNSVTQGSSTIPTEYIEVIRDLDEAYGTVNIEHTCEEEARIIFTRQAALATFLINASFLTCGALFFASQTDWDAVDVALFTVYTVTSAGYGHVEIPNTPLFQLVDTAYILIGLSLMAIMMAQLYKFVELEAVRLLHKHVSLKSEVLRDGIDNLSEQPTSVARDKALQSLKEQKDKQQTTAWLDTIVMMLSRVIQFSVDDPLGDFVYRIAALVGLAMLGGLTVGLLEQWPWYTCVYWSVVSLTTVGYGDVVPETFAGKAFTTVWLPLNLFFLSILFCSVGHYYLQFSDQQIQKISKQLQDNKKQQQASAATAAATASSDDMENQIDLEKGGSDDANSTSDEDGDNADPRECNRISPHPMYRRFFGTNLASMKEVLQVINSSNGHIDASDDQIGRLEGVEDNDSNTDTTPNFYLRVKVKERLAYIVANEVAGRNSSLTTGDKPGMISVYLGGIVQAAEKWMIPRSARPAFCAVAFEALLYIGEKRLIDEGVSALHTLTPLQFHRIFSPFLVAMGSDKETLQSWLTSTDVLWENECNNTVSKSKPSHRIKQISENSIHYGHRDFAKSGDKVVEFPTNHAEGFGLFS